MENPKVMLTVCCITFNHAKYIKQCIEGLLMQKADFKYQILIHDDASTDGTQEILSDYAKENPIITLVQQTENQYSQGKNPYIEHLIPKAEGKYLAICEGDDYWTDPYKLQKQVDFLENNPTYSMCFHSVTIVDEIKNTSYSKEVDNSKEFPSSQILLANMLHTVSFVLRKDDLINSKFLADNKTFGGDRLIVLIMSELGKLYFMKDNMAVYRIHSGGISNMIRTEHIVKYNRMFVGQYLYVKKTFKEQKTAATIKMVDHLMTISKHYYKNRNLKFLLYSGFAAYHQPSLLLKGIKGIFKRSKATQKDLG